MFMFNEMQSIKMLLTLKRAYFIIALQLYIDMEGE